MPHFFSTTKSILKLITTALFMVKISPLLVVYRFSKARDVIDKDVCRWNEIIPCSSFKPQSKIRLLAHFLMNYPEFRNLYYNRSGGFGSLFSFLCKPMDTLFITTKDIGPGLFIQHGFATVIAAQKIGSNCWVNQQVTIGYSNSTDAPIIGNNVSVTAGAKIIGKVCIGDNSNVGANAVVVKNVPSNVTVVGIPAYIVKRDGVSVNEKLQ